MLWRRRDEVPHPHDPPLLPTLSREYTPRCARHPSRHRVRHGVPSARRQRGTGGYGAGIFYTVPENLLRKSDSGNNVVAARRCPPAALVQPSRRVEGSRQGRHGARFGRMGKKRERPALRRTPAHGSDESVRLFTRANGGSACEREFVSWHWQWSRWAGPRSRAPGPRTPPTPPRRRCFPRRRAAAAKRSTEDAATAAARPTAAPLPPPAAPPPRVSDRPRHPSPTGETPCFTAFASSPAPSPSRAPRC